MITIQNYVRAQSLDEAWELNQKRANRIAGGMLWMKMSNTRIHTLIDLCDLGLGFIEDTEDAFYIGALVPLRELELHPQLNAYCNYAVQKALKSIVGVQFRNMAVTGGSLWGRFGFSDVLSVFLMMDSYVELYKGGIVSLEQFASMKKDNDILVRLIVRKTPGFFSYQSMRIQRTDFPVLTCAISCINGEFRAVYGARPGRAIILRDEKQLLSDALPGRVFSSNDVNTDLFTYTMPVQITEEMAAAFADYATEAVITGSNIRGSQAYRSHLVQVLTGRGLMELGGVLNGY